MDEYNSNKKYESFKIPDRKSVQGNGADKPYFPDKSTGPISLDDGLFYEIEYDSCSIPGIGKLPGVGKFVLKSQKIETPEKDEIRELFGQMRDIERSHHSSLNYSRFFDRRVQHDKSIIFYKQGLFMKDFFDDYSGNAQFSQYFPYYQMMGYEQLRTYFTWRTEVRKGNVSDTSLSYVFLYIYELLGNIGVNDPQDGLDHLMSFWKAFSVYNKSIDKYVIRWLKDYHIYYALPQSFKKFVQKYDLAEHYPPLTDTDDNFDLFCAISKYDIRKSVFYTGDKVKLITDCFYFVINKLRQTFNENGIQFDESIFQPTKKMSEWTPFKGALFHHWMKQPDRRIVLSENEIYICSQNKWAFSTIITSESSSQLMGYIMKQMESALRTATKYKFKLSANINSVTHVVVGNLKKAGLYLESIISDAVMEFYREATKTVVKVDHQALSIIRQEAFATQEKLIVEERDEPLIPIPVPLNLSFSTHVDMLSIPNDNESTDVWKNFKNILSATEIAALSVVLHGETDLKQFADECGVMLEVLVDGINEKAMDIIGDNLMDDAFVLYEDYRNQVKELVG